MKNIFAVSLALLFAAMPALATQDPRVIQKNKEAWKQLQSKDPLQAQEKLKDALSLGASDPFTRFNWATAKLLGAVDEQGKASPKIAEDALKELESLQRDLPRMPTTERAGIEKALNYQLGKGYEVTKAYDQALQHYYASILSGNPEPDLDKRSKASIARLLTEQQKQGGGGQSKDQQQQNGKDGKNDPSQQGKGKDQPKPKDGDDAGQNRQKPRFDQTDVSEQEARQILESVKNEEQEVQKRKTQAEARDRASKDGQEGKISEFNGKQW